MLLLTALMGLAAAVDLEFPRSSSRVDLTVSRPEPLGEGGGGYLYEAGEWVGDRFLTGLPSASYAHFMFDMDDHTGSHCPVGELTFRVEINRHVVGEFSYTGGESLGRISFDVDFHFPSIEGAGPDGTGFQVRFIANETVCDGGGSYNYFPGGLLILR